MEDNELHPENNIELHHESVEEIMGTPPSKIAALGSGLIFFILIGLFTGSFFITYKDIIKTTAIVYGAVPLEHLVVFGDGSIINLYNNSGDLVSAGDTIMQIRDMYSREFIPVIASCTGVLDIDPMVSFKSSVRQNDTIGLIWENKASPLICVISMQASEMHDIQSGNGMKLYFDKYKTGRDDITIDANIDYLSNFNSGGMLKAITQLQDDQLMDLHLKGELYVPAEILIGEKSIFYRLINPFNGRLKRFDSTQ